MSNVYDVNGTALIEAVAEKLEKIKEMEAPIWAPFVKTGVHKERPPVNKKWWYVRSAAVMRKLYILGPIGTAKLRTLYGGAKNMGYAPERFKKGSGNILRKVLQGLEKSGLAIQVVKSGHKGRILTPKGKSMLDKTASEIARSQKKE